MWRECRSSAANGKSQFIHLVRGMLPRTAHSAIAPSEMGKEQFLAELVGKTANLSNELSSTKAIASDKMKAVISGDVVSAKRVYRPVYQFTPQALHLFATNILPSFHDGVDEGIRRRFVAVSFTETISESDPPPMSWSNLIVSRGGPRNGNQETQSGRDRDEASPG